jgi:hypothetical protein
MYSSVFLIASFDETPEFNNSINLYIPNSLTKAPEDDLIM